MNTILLDGALVFGCWAVLMLAVWILAEGKGLPMVRLLSREMERGPLPEPREVLRPGSG